MVLGKRFEQWARFDRGLFHYALRTAIASGIALIGGWYLGLENPQWAAMSVWAASPPQQIKGMLLEKGLFRLLGTLVGTLVGVGILSLSHGNVLFIIFGLTVWLTLCTGAGNLSYGLFSYFTLLSGYTASLVVLLDVSQALDIYALGLDRMLTVALGVFIAMLAGALSHKNSNEDFIVVRIKLFSHDVLSLLSQAITAPTPSNKIAELLKEAAAIDALLEPHAAGSVRSRRSVHSLRAILHSNVSLLTRLHIGINHQQLHSIQRLLQQLLRTIEDHGTLKEQLRCIECILSQLGNSDLAKAMADLHTALAQRLRYKNSGKIERLKMSHMLVLHRDWVAAKQAMLRTFMAVGSVGVVWWITGSPIGAFVMLGTSVMVTLFSTFETPTSLVGRLIIWQLVGLAASLLTRGYVWPVADSEFQSVLMMVLCLLLVVIPMSSIRLTVGAMDYAMMYLLLTHVSYPVDFNLVEQLPIGFAAVGGTLIALFAFMLVFPTDRRKRSARIKKSMISDLSRIYHIEREGKKIEFIHARAQHRLLKWIQTEMHHAAKTEANVVEMIQLVASIQVIGLTRKSLAADAIAVSDKLNIIQARDNLYLQSHSCKAAHECKSTKFGAQVYYPCSCCAES